MSEVSDNYFEGTIPRNTKPCNIQEESIQEASIEETTVEDFLTLVDNGERLTLTYGEELVIADSEYHSKQAVREFADKVRNTLKAMVHSALQSLKYKTEEEQQPGFIVVDITWKRMLHLCKLGWLSTAAGKTFPVTVFASKADALKAIKDTKTWGNEKHYAWQNNEYIVISSL